MLNVHELERRWLRYKIRRFVPVGIASFSLIALAAAAVFLWPLLGLPEQRIPAVAASSQPTPSPTEPSQQTQQSLPSAEQARSATKQPDNTAPSQPAKNILAPSLSFMNRLKVEAIAAVPKEEKISRTESEPSFEPAAPKPAQEQVRIEKPQITAEQRPSHLSITQEDANDLNDVIKRFENNKSPALSLFVARRYYDMGQYDLSYEYALRTNKIDSTIEESWLIFARSLVKLGRKEEALKTLGTYAQHSGSAQAKMLLEEIKQGTFQ